MSPLAQSPDWPAERELSGGGREYAGQRTAQRASPYQPGLEIIRFNSCLFSH